MASGTRAGAAPRDPNSGGTAGDLRRLNLERVLAVAMDREAPFTRAEIIGATGLSAPTVGSLVTDLIQHGMLTDLGTGPSRGGRRPAFMEFNARYGYVGAIDLGPTRTRLAVADLRGERLAHDVIATPAGVDAPAQAARLAAALRGLMSEAGVSAERLLVVAAGAPGVVDRDRGLVTVQSSNLGWSDAPIRALLEKALRAPVVVENDVNLAVLGEHWRGAARGHDTCAFITVGTGIGAGILVDGHLMRGHHFVAGEIGFMSMGPEYVGRDFRARGCLETLAGLQALASRWPGARDAHHEGWMPELFAAAEAGDAQARQAVDDTAGLIGIATANLILVLDPSLVVLGGALFSHGETLADAVRRTVSRIVPARTEIVVSALGKEAPLWGTLLVATEEARKLLRQRLWDARIEE